MAPNRLWLAHEAAGINVVPSLGRTANGNSGDLTLATLLGEVNVVGAALAVGVSITVQGGTQASVDFDLEWKINSLYFRVARRNITPAAGLLAFIFAPRSIESEQAGLVGPIEFWPETYRVVWTFNTPGATPTITFSCEAAGWGYRNIKIGYPGMRT